ncbi:MAG: hypothetical protein IBX50_19330 [Marinospirillum sp.]|uniref:YfaZ family outer membrane protein n=1 Tax=Marinospirillum sp. TaxID=2183934 RepID=UPI001A026B5A|nr:YfaZ family outer membrane protein [Marinospirillum sp.]MBE0508843.1 hypothetical protein [Marinospirillum sp.]
MLTKPLNTSLATALLLALSATQASAFSLAPGSLEANMNNNTLQIEYDRPMVGTSNLHTNASVLYTERNSEGSALVGTLGLQGVETDGRTFRAAIGGRLYLIDAPGSEHGAALAFGGLFYHVVPGAQRVSIGGYGWYAPPVTSFSDTDKVYEFGARVAYRAIQNTDVFLGYRYLYLENDNGFDGSLEKGMHLGFRLNF